MTGLAVELLNLRLAANLTQREAAEKAGLAVLTVHAAEHGRAPSLGTLTALLAVYGRRLDIVAADVPLPPASPDLRRLPVDPERLQRLRADRERLRMSQARLAQLLQVPPQTMQHYEAGRAHPPVALADRWEALLTHRVTRRAA